MILQLVGAWFVWMDLTKTAKDFGEAPSFRKTLNWLKSLFRTPPSVQAIVFVVEDGEIMNVSGHVPIVTQSGQPIEERVAKLEKQAINFMHEIGTLREDIGSQKEELKADINRRTSELQRSIGNLENQIKDAFIGNYAVLNFGAIWLVVGIILSSMAVEITNLIHLRQFPRMW